MAAGGAGYFHSNYFHTDYWHLDYWAENGSAAPASGAYKYQTVRGRVGAGSGVGGVNRAVVSIILFLLLQVL